MLELELFNIQAAFNYASALIISVAPICIFIAILIKVVNIFISFVGGKSRL